ncbi:MAG TPA: hypothetical protein VHB27_22340 [Rhodopila sp.]|uniref:hypothetical protein n=1 Tax=Rhodopila sp. TaxID=2480087 RepID=UPI002C2E0726|nr:hypothetical protein [Rhodopila sp.]HVY17975.1 hypothetical protein [Rhodopila sp.]
MRKERATSPASEATPAGSFIKYLCAILGFSIEEARDLQLKAPNLSWLRRFDFIAMQKVSIVLSTPRPDQHKGF